MKEKMGIQVLPMLLVAMFFQSTVMKSSKLSERKRYFSPTASKKSFKIKI